jgi:hypothetical protein
MEKRYWNCRSSLAGGAEPLPLLAADAGSMRCIDSRDSEYTSSCPVPVRAATTFDRFVNGFEV